MTISGRAVAAPGCRKCHGLALSSASIIARLSSSNCAIRARSFLAFVVVTVLMCRVRAVLVAERPVWGD